MGKHNWKTRFVNALLTSKIQNNTLRKKVLFWVECKQESYEEMSARELITEEWRDLISDLKIYSSLLIPCDDYLSDHTDGYTDNSDPLAVPVWLWLRHSQSNRHSSRCWRIPRRPLANLERAARRYAV